jgi:WD40 repeat protein
MDNCPDYLSVDFSGDWLSRLSADFSRIGVYDLRSGKDQHLMQLLLTHEPQAVRLSV